MASTTPKITTRPGPLRSSRSFPRQDAQNATPETTRSKRASTIQNGAAAGAAPSLTSAVPAKPLPKPDGPDAFETSAQDGDDSVELPRASVDLEDLPIELISYTDSFIDSLLAKTQPTPPSIDDLTERFQNFYAQAATHIATHVATVSSLQQRDRTPPQPNPSPRPSAASVLRGKAASIGSKEKAKPLPERRDSDQQMLTAEELAERKRARKALEQKKVEYEEAVERRLCEGIYGRIYRHRASQDEAQDDKLRSKTAALDVVGIGPADLGVDLGDLGTPSPTAAAEKQQEVRTWLEGARKEIVLMNESRYPLGKLNHLKAAHKSIIDTLSHFHPSSSADELMPMLIYTLITLPPENLNVISDVQFIHRFRWEPKLQGETAYCLTNLEAAISFLETVDLSTLRADEAPSGPLRPPSQPGTPKAETFPPAYSSVSVSVTSASTDAAAAAAGLKPSPSPSGLRAAVQLRNRRLSDLVNTPAQAIGAASDAVFTTADHSLKTIGTSLGDSYKFLLGKLLERPDSLTTSSGEMIVPKTLDDARKLIGTPPPDDDESVNGADSVQGGEETEPPRRVSSRMDDKMLNLIGGRKVSRDHSADSSRSASSSKKVVFAEESKDKASSATPTPASNPAIIDSVRNFGNSLNPMVRLSGIGGFRGFGRTSSTPAMPVTKDAAAAKGVADGGDLATAFPDLAAALPPKEVPQISPPNQRFMELQNPGELRLSEVLDLLRDYRRLAGALKDMGAFKE